MAGTLETIRSEILAGPSGFDLPVRLLEEYTSRRTESRLTRILAEARRLRDTVDRLVIVAGGSMAPATRLLVSACCHPFHDQLPRGERGGRPRLTWIDTDADTDRLQGMLDVVAPEGRPPSNNLLDQWAILAVDAGAGESEPCPLAIAESLTRALAKATAHDTHVLSEHMVSDRVVAVARPGSPLAAWAEAVGGPTCFYDEGDTNAEQGVFTSAALVPASTAGINIVRLLEGAAAMLVRFAEAPIETNPVLADAAMRWCAAREAGHVASHFLGGGPALADLTAWARHIRPAPAGASAVVTHVVIAEPRRTCLMPSREPPSASTNHPLTIRLPRLDEHALGQLLELVILSAAVEGRLGDGV